MTDANKLTAALQFSAGFMVSNSGRFSTEVEVTNVWATTLWVTVQ